jgi:Uma2 family endonuclease
MQPHARVSEDEYLARERLADERSELVNGHIVAMAGASPRHNAIVRNILLALGSRLRGKPCQPFPSDQRVHVPATGLYAYPDVSVICGALERHRKDDATVLNPRVLVEVLSERTEAFDRGAKFAHYRSIASLRTYVLVTQDEERVEWYERGDDGAFTLHEAVGDGATVRLPSIEVDFPLADLYVDLPSDVG